MAPNGKLVQVSRPTPDNSLAMGTVWRGAEVAPSSDIPEMYILAPESLADHERFGGMLFTEEELEALP